jgi:biotin transporter BioY
MMAGVFVIYAVGTAWLAAVLGLSAAEAVALGVAPFLLLDVVKSLLAAGAARAVTTRS